MSTNSERITYHNQLIDRAQEKVSALPKKPVLEELSVTENGEYMPPNGVDGFDKVKVNVGTGAAVEVCSVAIDWGETATLEKIYVTIFNGETIECVDVYPQGVGGVVVIPNVVVNSTIVAVGLITDAETYEGIELLEHGAEPIGFIVKGNGSIEIFGLV